MGLRGCVDAWGAPVKKPELAGMTERFKPAAPVNTVNKPPVNKPSPVNKPVPVNIAAEAARKTVRRETASLRAAMGKPVTATLAKAAKPATDRGAYLREYMRAKRAKEKAAKASKP